MTPHRAVATAVPPAPTHATADPAIPIAAITIPRLAVSAPVYDRGLDRDHAMIIASGYTLTHFTYSALPGAVGNVVLYGHDDIEGSIFHYLPAMQVGDPIEITVGPRHFTYRVTGSRVVAPSDVAILHATTTPTLTLFSCTPYMVDTQRIVITAALTSAAVA